MSTTEATASSTTTTHSAWTTFAGVMLGIAGVANALWGWAALRDAGAWGDYRPIADAAFVGPLEFWGWAALIWAALVLVGSVLLLTEHSSGRILGITLASISAILWLLVLPTLPLLAVAVLAIDILVIYGLVVHDKTVQA